MPRWQHTAREQAPNLWPTPVTLISAAWLLSLIAPHAASVCCVRCVRVKSAVPSTTGAGRARPAQDRGGAPGGRIGGSAGGRRPGVIGAGERARGGAGGQEGRARRAAAGGDRGGCPAGGRRRHCRCEAIGLGWGANSDAVASCLHMDCERRQEALWGRATGQLPAAVSHAVGSKDSSKTRSRQRRGQWWWSLNL
jgi:hypothetical protein